MHGALPKLDAAFALFAVGITATPELGLAIAAHAHALAETMQPWSTGGSYNFAEEPTDTRTAFACDTYERLRSIRRQVDPTGVLKANHPIDVAQ